MLRSVLLFSALALLGGITFADETAENVDYLCTDCNNASGCTVRYPPDCNKFVLCDPYGRGHLFCCSDPQLQFSTVTGHCEFKGDIGTCDYVPRVESSGDETKYYGFGERGLGSYIPPSPPVPAETEATPTPAPSDPTSTPAVEGGP